MTRLTFETPPPRKSTARKTDPRSIANTATADQLRAQPDEWAIITVRTTQTRAAAYAYAINHGVLHAYRPAGTFEAVSRTVDGEHRVYARYIGDTPAGSEQ